MSRNITPVPSANVAALVLELQTIADRLDARGIPSWLAIARAAFILAGVRHGITKTAELGGINVELLVIELESISDRFELLGNKDFKPVTKAASLIEGLRLGITAIADDAPPANWFGVDLASGPDQNVEWSVCHAG